MVDQAFMEAIAAADRITDPVLRGDIMRDPGAVGDAKTRTLKLPHWPDPLPPTTALRLLGGVSNCGVFQAGWTKGIGRPHRTPEHTFDRQRPPTALLGSGQMATIPMRKHIHPFPARMAPEVALDKIALPPEVATHVMQTLVRDLPPLIHR